jgi:hypothetical protein
MMHRRRALLSSAVFVLGLGLDLLSDACDGSTTGRRVAFATVVGPAAGTTAPFTNAEGWEIRLDRALVSVGALYAFEGASLFSRVPPRLLGVRSAFAHPGHYQEGTALGEMRVPASLDLLEGDAPCAAGEGISGAWASGRVLWGTPAAGRFAVVLGDRVALVEGTATKGPDVRRFSFAVSASDVLDASGAPRVEGVAFEGEPAVVSGDGTLTVRIAPAVWLAQVDFSDDGVARRAFARGIKDGSAWAFSFTPSPGAP